MSVKRVFEQAALDRAIVHREAARGAQPDALAEGRVAREDVSLVPRAALLEEVSDALVYRAERLGRRPMRGGRTRVQDHHASALGHRGLLEVRHTELDQLFDPGGAAVLASGLDRGRVVVGRDDAAG